MGDMSREPSMEDILSSIRRVIARDEAAVTSRDTRPARAEDVLELCEQEQEIDSAPAHVADAHDEELVSAKSADAARQSLEALNAAVAPAPSAAESATGSAGRSMEDVVLDALRPMLKEWLDANLPTMVEGMVAKEISRITGRRL